MRVVIFEQPGNESVLKIGDVESPRLTPGEVRIRVAAAGVNRADILQRRGLYPPPPGASEILGLECAGEVIEVGREIGEFSPGDRVMALLAGGGYAEEVVAPAACTMHVPERLPLNDAAGVPEVFITAFFNLFELGSLSRGETALVHGGSGGVGTAAIQLAKAAGARVVVTAGSEDRCRRCLELGADAAVNYRQQDFALGTLDVSGGRGADVILDCIGASYLERHLEVLATGGRLVLIGLQGGTRTEIDLAQLLRKRLRITGSTLRARSVDEKGRIISGFLERFGDRLADGAIAPVIDRALPFAEAGEAHRLLKAGKIFGKIVLTPA
jgi:putative PIG3 family NAD(P)H quinone oxidoreductase